MAARITSAGGNKPDKLMRNALMLAVSRETTDEKGKTIKYINKIAAMLVSKAADGDVPAAIAIADRIDGKPAQQVELGTPPGSNFTVTWQKD